MSIHLASPGTTQVDPRELSSTARLLLIILRKVRSYTDRRGRVLRRIGQGSLAHKLNRSKRTVRRLITELEQAGHLLRIAPRRAFDGERWRTLECQSYAFLDDHGAIVSAGQAGRTFVSGHPYRGSSAWARGGATRADNAVSAAQKQRAAAQEQAAWGESPGPDWKRQLWEGRHYWVNTVTGQEQDA